MKIRLLIFLLLVFVQSILAQSSLLWEVSGSSLKEKSYILGTIHLIPKRDYFFPEIWKQKLAESQTVVFEADIKPPLSEQLAMLQKVMFVNSTTLRDYVPDDYYVKLNIFLRDSLRLAQATINKIMKIKPAYSSALILKKVIKGPEKVYELEIYKLAKKMHKKFYFLETIDFQLSLIDSIPIYEQALNFLYNPDEGTNLLSEYYKTLHLYKQCNVDSIANYTYKDADSTFLSRFIIERNKKWIPQLERLFRQGKTFVAVGSGHLGGKYGILTMLKSRGYTLKPVICNNL